MFVNNNSGRRIYGKQKLERSESVDWQYPHSMSNTLLWRWIRSRSWPMKQKFPAPILTPTPNTNWHSRDKDMDARVYPRRRHPQAPHITTLIPGAVGEARDSRRTNVESIRMLTRREHFQERTMALTRSHSMATKTRCALEACRRWGNGSLSWLSVPEPYVCRSILHCSRFIVSHNDC